MYTQKKTQHRARLYVRIQSFESLRCIESIRVGLPKHLKATRLCFFVFLWRIFANLARYYKIANET